MVLTFGQYTILVAMRSGISGRQLLSQVEFDHVMVNYYLTMLLEDGLIKTTHRTSSNDTCYGLTDTGANCLDDYELHNPALIIRELAY